MNKKIKRNNKPHLSIDLKRYFQFLKQQFDFPSTTTIFLVQDHKTSRIFQKVH